MKFDIRQNGLTFGQRILSDNSADAQLRLHRGTGLYADIATTVNAFQIELNDVIRLAIISSTGNVGIGTTAPSGTLHISSTNTLTGNSRSGQLVLDSGNTSRSLSMDDNEVQAWAGTSTGSILYLNRQGGNVGIGMGVAGAIPSTTLDVSGTFRIAGTGAETCSADHIGMNRRNPVTGKVEMCRY